MGIKQYLLLCLYIGIIAGGLVLPAFCGISSGSDYELVSSVISNSGGQYLLGGEYMSRGTCGQSISSDAQNIARSQEYSERSGFYNPPYFTYQRALPLNFKNSFMELTVPANSVEKETFDIFLNTDPNQTQKKQEIKDANQKAQINMGQMATPVIMSELYFWDEESRYEQPLRQKGSFIVRVNDDDGDGNVDGTNPPVRLSSLKGYVLDEDYKMWLRMFNSDVDVNSKRVMFDFTQPGIYSVLGELDDSVKKVYAFPVPFRPNGPNAGNGPGQTGTKEGGITFADIPQTGRIEIYTLDGRLVRKLPIPLNLVQPKLRWDVKNGKGEKVVSGVYVWRVVSGGNSKTGKLMIIR